VLFNECERALFSFERWESCWAALKAADLVHIADELDTDAEAVVEGKLLFVLLLVACKSVMFDVKRKLLLLDVIVLIRDVVRLIEE
jgi:hypothetical protein